MMRWCFYDGRAMRQQNLGLFVKQHNVHGHLHNIHERCRSTGDVALCSHVHVSLMILLQAFLQGITCRLLSAQPGPCFRQLRDHYSSFSQYGHS
jgi:hypothetical protein